MIDVISGTERCAYTASEMFHSISFLLSLMLKNVIQPSNITDLVFLSKWGSLVQCKY